MFDEIKRREQQELIISKLEKIDNKLNELIKMSKENKTKNQQNVVK